jgi:integrase
VSGMGCSFFTGAVSASRASGASGHALAGSAGLEGRLVHDLRRTAARDFRRRGVSEGEIMKLCGGKTRAMFDRYNIIDEADLAEALAKRFTTPQRRTKEANTGKH